MVFGYMLGQRPYHPEVGEGGQTVKGEEDSTYPNPDGSHVSKEKWGEKKRDGREDD